MNNTKVMVLNPNPGTVSSGYHRACMAMREWDISQRNVICRWADVEGTFVDDSRNLLAQHFLAYEHELEDKTKIKPDWSLWIDSDISFHPEALYWLLDHADPIEKPIITAQYFTWIKDRFTLAWFQRREDDAYETFINVDAKLQRIGAAGMGFCLVHRTVFQRIRAKFGEEWFTRSIVTKHGRLGEDVAFFERCFQCTIPAWGEGRLVVDHRKMQVENMETMQTRVKAWNWDKLQAEKNAAEESALSSDNGAAEAVK